MLTNMLSTFLIFLALIQSNEAKHQFDHYMPSDSGHVPLSYQQAEKGILHKNEDNPIISDKHEQSEEDLIQQEQSDADKLLKAALEFKAGNYGDSEEVTQTEKELLDRAAVEVVRLSSRLPQSTEERNTVVENLMRLVAADDAVQVSSGSAGYRRKKRSIKNYPSYKWKYGIIPAVFSSSLTLNDRDGVRSGASLLEYYSCVRVVDYVKDVTRIQNNLDDEGFVNFTKSSGCWSTLGARHNPLGQNTACCGGYTCSHELGHTLGLIHDHQDAFRDMLVNVQWENIQPDYRMWYETETPPLASDNKDIGSIMSYGNWAFGISGAGPTMTAYEDYVRFGSTTYALFKDINEFTECINEERCPGFNKDCGKFGFPAYVSGKCTCHCLDGLDPNTGCTTVRTNFTGASSTCWPNGDYAIPMPKTGCPGNNEFDEATYIQAGESGMWTYSVYNLGWVYADYLVRKMCVRKNTPTTPKCDLTWRPGQYGIYRVGPSCPVGFHQAFAVFADYTANRNNSYTGPRIAGEFLSNQTRIEYCVRNDGLPTVPLDLPNDKPFVLYRIDFSHECPMVQGMYGMKEWYSFNSAETTVFGRSPDFYAANEGNYKALGYTWGSKFFYIYYCYYTPMAFGGFIKRLDDSTPSVDIISPGYPVGYPDLATYTWLVTSPEKSKIVLKVNFMDIHFSTACRDFLEIRLGEPYSPPQVICGTSAESGLLGNLVAKGNIVHIQLKTDPIVSRPGFNITATFVKDTELRYLTSDYGASYRGTRNYTVNYEPCVRWDEVSSHCSYGLFHMSGDDRGLEKNYCRNPSSTGFRPWCYTSKETCSRASCDVGNLAGIKDTLTDCQARRALGECEESPVEVALTGCAYTCRDLLPRELIPPKVSEVHCGAPQPPRDGTPIEADLKATYKVGDKVRVRCRFGNDEAVMTCTTDGQWSRLGYVCGGCSQGEVYYALNRTKDVPGLCYRYVDILLTFSKAQDFCLSQYGGHLADFTSAFVTQIYRSARKGMQRVMIGITYDATKDTWVNMDGTPATGVPWDLKGGDSGDCAFITGEDKVLRSQCYTERPFVCARSASERELCRDRYPHCEDLLERRPDFCTAHADGPARVLCPWTCNVCSSKTHFEDCTSNANCSSPFVCDSQRKICLCPSDHIWKTGACVPISQVMPAIQVTVVDTTTVNIHFCNMDPWIKRYDVIISSSTNPSVLSSSLTSCQMSVTGLKPATSYSFALTVSYYYTDDHPVVVTSVPFRTKSLLTEACLETTDCIDTKAVCLQGTCQCPSSYVWFERDRVCRAFCPDLYYSHESECAKKAEKGDCQANVNWMKTYCAGTCNICPTACSNTWSSATCMPRVFSGDCVSALSTMTSSCARSCNLCPNDCSNKLNDTDCQARVTRGECVSNATFMKTNCPKACGVCPGYGEACTDHSDCNDFGTVCLNGICACANNTAWKDGKCRLTDCKDLNTNCPYYASVNLCPADPYTIANCRKSCGRCGTFDDVCNSSVNCAAAGTLCISGRCLCPEQFVWNSTACVPVEGAVPVVKVNEVTASAIAVTCSLVDPAYAFLVTTYTATFTSGASTTQYQSPSCNFRATGLYSNTPYTVIVETALKYMGGVMTSAPVLQRTAVGIGDACSSNQSCYGETVRCNASFVCDCQVGFFHLDKACLSNAGTIPLVTVWDATEKSVKVACTLTNPNFQNMVTEYKLLVWNATNQFVDTSSNCNFTRTNLFPATTYNASVTATLTLLGEKSVSKATLFRTVSCADSHGMCAYWASIGECTKNPAYMLSVCKKSCKICGTAGLGQACNSSLDCLPAWSDCGTNKVCYCLEGRLPKNGLCESDAGAVPVLTLGEVTDRSIEVSCTLTDPGMSSLVSSYKVFFTSASSTVSLESPSCSFRPTNLTSNTLYSVSVQASLNYLGRKTASLPQSRRTGRGLGDECNNDQDCLVQGAVCDTNFVCVCGPGFLPLGRSCMSDDGATPMVTVGKITDVAIALSCVLSNASFASVVTGYSLALSDGTTLKQFQSATCNFSATGLTPATTHSVVVNAILNYSDRHKSSDVLSLRTATCADYSTSCPSKAASGQCTSDPTYMNSNCRLSCAKCGFAVLGGACTATTDCRNGFVECDSLSKCACILGYLPSNGTCVSDSGAVPVLSVGVVTDRSISVTCSLPNQSLSSLVTSYTATFTSQSSSKQITSSSCSFTASDLSSTTNYNILVRATTSYKGRNFTSLPTTVKTGSSLNGVCAANGDCFPENSYCQSGACLCKNGFLPSGADCTSDAGAVPVITLGEITDRSIRVTCTLTNSSFASSVTSYSVFYYDGTKFTSVTSETCDVNPTSLSRFTSHNITVIANLNYQNRQVKSAVTVQKTATCSDYNGNCVYWSTTNECVKNLAYMSGSCKHACSLCGKYNEDCLLDKDCSAQGSLCLQSKCLCPPNISWNGTGCFSGFQETCTMDSQCTTPGSKCLNNVCACPSNYVWLDSKCQLGRCRDLVNDCPSWSSQGHCTSNPGYMESNCMKSCGVCGDYQDPCLEVQDCGAKGTRCEGNRCVCPSGSQWDGAMCLSGYGQGCAEDLHCSGHGGVCSSGTCQCAPDYAWNGTSCVYARCPNTQTLCQSWADQGSCTSSSSYMKDNCPLACKFCGGYQALCVQDTDCWPALSVCLDNRCQCDSSFYWNGTQCVPDSDSVPVVTVGSVTDRSIAVTCLLTNQSYAQSVDSYSATYSSTSGSVTLTSTTCSFAPTTLTSDTEYSIEVKAILKVGGAMHSAAAISQKTAKGHGNSCSNDVECFGNDVICSASTSKCVCAEGLLLQNGNCVSDSGLVPMVTVGTVTDSSMLVTCSLPDSSLASYVTSYTATFSAGGDVITLNANTCSFQPSSLSSNTNYTVSVQSHLSYEGRSKTSSPVVRKTASALGDPCSASGCYGNHVECHVTSVCVCSVNFLPNQDACVPDSGAVPVLNVADVTHDSMSVKCSLTDPSLSGLVTSYDVTFSDGVSSSSLSSASCSFSLTGLQSNREYSLVVTAHLSYLNRQKASAVSTQKTKSTLEDACVTDADCYGQEVRCGPSNVCFCAINFLPKNGACASDSGLVPMVTVGTVTDSSMLVTCSLPDSSLASYVTSYTATFSAGGDVITLNANTCSFQPSSLSSNTNYTISVQSHLSYEGRSKTSNPVVRKTASVLNEPCDVTSDCHGNHVECHMTSVCACSVGFLPQAGVCVSDAGAVPIVSVGAVTDTSMQITCALTDSSLVSLVTDYTVSFNDDVSTLTLTSSTCSFNPTDLDSLTEYMVTVTANLAYMGRTKTSSEITQKTASALEGPCSSNSDCYGSHVMCHDSSVCACSNGFLPQYGACLADYGAVPVVSVGDITDRSIAISCSLANDSYVSMVSDYTATLALTSGSVRKLTSSSCAFLVEELDSGANYSVTVEAQLNYLGRSTTSEAVYARTLDCVNHDVRCEAWKDGDYCATNEWMTSSEACRRACGMCKGGCADASLDCQAYRAAGHCENATYSLWMWENCRVTCGVCGGHGEACKYDSGCTAPGSVCQDGVCGCPPGSQWSNSQCQPVGCEDVFTDCAAWAEQGYCVRTPEYMGKVCKKSCNFCPDDCQDTGTNCQSRVDNGECGSDYMLSNCMQSCQSCPGHGGTCNTHQDCSIVGTMCKNGHCECSPSTYWKNGKCIPSCSDTDISCSEEASNGQCSESPQWMLVHCRLACNACGEFGNPCLSTAECTASGTECIDLQCACPATQVWFNNQCVSDAGAIPVLAVGTVTDSSIAFTCSLSDPAFAAIVTDYTATYSDGTTTETMTSSTCEFDLSGLKSNTNYSITVGARLSNGAVKTDSISNTRTKSLHGEWCQSDTDCSGNSLQCQDGALCLCSPGLLFRQTVCVSDASVQPVVAVVTVTNSSIALTCSLTDEAFSNLVTTYTVTYTDGVTTQSLTSSTCTFDLTGLHSNTAYVITVRANLNYYGRSKTSASTSKRTASSLEQACTVAIGCYGNHVQCDASSSICVCAQGFILHQGNCIADDGVRPVISVDAVTDRSISVTCSLADTSLAEHVTSFTAIFDNGATNVTLTSGNCSFNPTTLKSNTDYSITVVAALSYLGRKKPSLPSVRKTASALGDSCGTNSCYGNRVECHVTSVCVCRVGFLPIQGSCEADAGAVPVVTVGALTDRSIAVTCAIPVPALASFIANYTATYHDGVQPRTLTSASCSFAPNNLDSYTQYTITVVANLNYFGRKISSASVTQRTAAGLGGTCTSSADCYGNQVVCHTNNLCICAVGYLPELGQCVSDTGAVPVITVGAVTETSIAVTCSLTNANMAGLVSSYSASFHNGTSARTLTSPTCSFQPTDLLGGVQYNITVTAHLNYYGRNVSSATVSRATAAVLDKACTSSSGCVGVNVECHTSLVCVCQTGFLPRNGSCISDSGVRPVVTVRAATDRSLNVTCVLTDPSLASFVKNYTATYNDGTSSTKVTATSCSFNPVSLKSMTTYSVTVTANLNYLDRSKASAVVSGRTTACSDYDSYCPNWASGGECVSSKSWMESNCKKSCAVCGTYNASCVVEADCGAKGTECRTEKCLCPIGIAWNGTGCLAGFGAFCTKDSQCAPEGTKCLSGACVCPADYVWDGAKCVYARCKDDNTNCPVWKDYGHCSISPGYMLVNCKYSCKVCGGYQSYCVGNGDCTAQGTSCVNKKCLCPSTIPWTGSACVSGLNGVCQTDAHCSVKGSFCSNGTCVCPATHVYNGTVCAYAICQDGNTNCAYWASAGECTKNPGYMLSNCKKACAQCGFYGDICLEDTHCGPRGTVCTNQRCSCPANITWDGTACSAALGQHCLSDLYCSVKGSKCINNTCSCPTDHVYNGVECKYAVCENNDANCVYWPSLCSSNTYVINNCKKTCQTCGVYGDVCIQTSDCVSPGAQCLSNRCLCPTGTVWNSTNCVQETVQRRKRDVSLWNTDTEQHDFCVVPTLDLSWGVSLDPDFSTVYVEDGVQKVRAGGAVHYVCSSVTSVPYTGNLVRSCSRHSGRLLGKQPRCQAALLVDTMLNDVELVDRDWFGDENMVYVGSKNNMFKRDGCLKNITYFSRDKRHMFFQVWTLNTAVEGRRLTLKKQWELWTEEGARQNTFEIPEGGYNVEAKDMLGLWYGGESKRGGIPFTDCAYKQDRRKGTPSDDDIDYTRDARVFRLLVENPLQIPSKIGMLNALSDPVCHRFSLNAVIEPPCPVTPPAEEMERVQDIGFGGV